MHSLKKAKQEKTSSAECAGGRTKKGDGGKKVHQKACEAKARVTLLRDVCTPAYHYPQSVG